MMTARVLRPYVASISLWRSLASWMIRLIGADSGLTMEMIRFADTMLPNPMLISLIVMRPFLLGRGLRCRNRALPSPAFHLFDVLYLLAHLFQFRLHLHDENRQFRLGGLGSDRVDFPVQFLDQKVQLASDRIGGFQHVGELVQMAADSRQLLVDV